MKKVLSTLLVAGVIALVACGQSAEEKAASDKAMQDSIAAAEQASAGANKEQQAMQDSANSMMDSSAHKMAADSVKK